MKSVNGQKRCCMCHFTKEVAQFCADRNEPDGLLNRCRPCNSSMSSTYHAKNKDKAKNRWLLHKFNITLTQYTEILARQGGRCAVCHRTNPEQKYFPVDHKHSTGQVRGILCGTCNVGIGMFYDNPELLRQAAQYLEQAGGKGIAS